MFTRNASKLFPPDDYSTKGRKTKKLKIEENEKDSVHNLVERLKPKENSEEIKQNKKVPVTEIVLRAEFESKTRELEQYQVEAASQRSDYSVSILTADVIRMETGLPTKIYFILSLSML